MAVALRGAFCISLDALALECLVAHVLAVIALYRSRSVFEGTSHTRFPSSVKESVSQEPPCVDALRQIHNHRSICLRIILFAKPCNLGHGGFILFAEGCYGSGSNLVVLIQHGGPVYAINFDRVELVPEHPGPRADLGFCHFLDYLVLVFITARYSDSVSVLRVHGDSAAALVRVAVYSSNLCLDRRPNLACGYLLVCVFCHL